jgi:SAM-dependent methyltransferase
MKAPSKKTKLAAAAIAAVPPAAVVPAAPLRIDIGCGKNKREGFIGVDALALPGVDVVCDIRGRWPFEDNSVDEAAASHVIEHLTNLNGAWERVHFFNELHRVLKPGAKCHLAFPHWASNRYYGDPTHREPFSEMGFCYLNRQWRLEQAPHTDGESVQNLYTCDFDWSYGYGLHPGLQARNTEYQQHALTFWKEAAQDIVAQITKRG